MWTCPGHNGGMFYRRSPVGRVFYEYLGETVFRADLDNSVVELGDLLVHEGAARKAEAAAAEILGADRTYFVPGGTSMSNKVTAGALVARGDLVLFDRNNHKSLHHGALVLAGGIPVYLPADRNPQGLIGPIDPGALAEDRIRAAIREYPLVTDPDRWRAERPFRLAIIEQCSYDGTIYAGRLLPGLPDPPQAPAHRRPATARHRGAVQRGVPAARLDLAVLSAVRVAGRRRADNEGPQRLPPVERGHPPVHLRIADRRNSSGRTSSPQRCMSPGPSGTPDSCGM